jgi:hypothetical protein
MIDYEALWSSDKIARCAGWAQAEYAWLYGLANAYGCFELTNLRVIWGKVAAIRENLSLARLGSIFDEFHDKGLLFTWEEGGKRYGHWTNSDRPGRLPPASLRARYARTTPEVPVDQLQEYMEEAAKCSSQGGIIDASMTPHPREGKDRVGKDRRGCGGTKNTQASPSCVSSYFEEFWKKYPCKKAKVCAEKAAKKIAEEDWPRILADVERRKDTEEWTRDKGRFVPYPAKYLNERRWEDIAATPEEQSVQIEVPDLEAPPWRSRN